MNETREEMVKFIKDFVTRDYVMKVKICRHIGISLPTMNRIIAGAKVSNMSVRHAYLMIKDME